MNISLHNINQENWEKAISLSVADEQKQFMASNLYSIAEVQFLKNFKTMGIYLEEKMIGFTMFGIDPDDGNYWIYRLMIDQAYQGNGYGKKAVELVISDIKSRNNSNIPLIMIGYHPSNIGAKWTYKKAGFIETEMAPWGEQLAEYSL
ncbi:GNAT family N-acetyltransferase [Bacillus pinisoli]|uniref:GNAT family N-acetyltransferase n=1 Tax=Bacillus pinisoli TaxID=2901866 RepID=UPI001FF33905|nr:GNAT family N-acetyltransferase [Bacillus pinisoli]